jgi:hypothetical protein
MRELDSLEAEEFRAPKNRCTVAFILEQLEPDERERLTAVIDAGVVPASRIAQLLRNNGFSVQYTSVGRHRRRLDGASGCACQ